MSEGEIDEEYNNINENSIFSGKHLSSIQVFKTAKKNNFHELHHHINQKLVFKVLKKKILLEKIINFFDLK